MALKATKINFVYQSYEVDELEKYHLTEVRFFVSDSIVSNKGILKRLELGFAPAVEIPQGSFEEFCALGRGDW